MIYQMKNKTPLLIVLALLSINLLSNSCKKDNQGTISSLFTNGNWQLASVIVTTTDSLITVTDTLNANCNLTQLFTFNADNTCTYTNFDCQSQTKSGNWSLSTDQLTLYSNITCNFTSVALSSKPFINAQIYSIGLYSMVLQTGDYNVIPTQTNKTKVIRYGFVRQKAAI
jgi:hypothetical protein